MKKYVIKIILLLTPLLSFTQCVVQLNNGDAWYVGVPYDSSINYAPPSLDGIGSTLTWETETSTEQFTAIRKKYQYRILNLSEETTFQWNIGYSFQNFGNGVYSFPHQTINELTPIMQPTLFSFLMPPSEIPLPRVGFDFFMMDGCPHEESTNVLVSSKKVSIPVDYMIFENELGVTRCVSGIVGDIDMNSWNKGVKIGLTLPAGEYWFYVGFEIDNGISNWGWIQWSLTYSLTPCSEIDVFFEPFEKPFETYEKPKETHIHRYKKVVLMEGPYRGILLYDELQDRYYDFTLREVKLK